jgi:SAM-dependent methyltransferase
MLDKKIYNLIKEKDFSSISPLELRPFFWGSLEVYDKEIQKRLSKYESKYDLLHWMSHWTEKKRLISPFKGNKIYEEIKKKSSISHINVFEYLFSKEIVNKKLHNGYDIYNAIDGYLINKHCKGVSTTLDFGSGYGRLGCILGQKNSKMTYISVDCIERSYLLQNLFLSLFAPKRFYEYFDFRFENKEFKILKGNNIYHLPTWKMEIIKNNSVDLITAVFVLNEINQFALNHFINQARRVLKKGGYIYIKDHLYQTGEKSHKGAHKNNTEVELKKAGFDIIFQGNYKDDQEIFGIPRILKKK